METFCHSEYHTRGSELADSAGSGKNSTTFRWFFEHRCPDAFVTCLDARKSVSGSSSSIESENVKTFLNFISGIHPVYCQNGRAQSDCSRCKRDERQKQHTVVYVPIGFRHRDHLMPNVRQMCETLTSGDSAARQEYSAIYWS
jgi:hypothetical protein